MNPLLHVYNGYAVVCDGERTMRIPLTEVQIVQLAADAANLAADILRRSNVHHLSGAMAGGDTAVR